MVARADEAGFPLNSQYLLRRTAGHETTHDVPTLSSRCAAAPQEIEVLKEAHIARR